MYRNRPTTALIHTRLTTIKPYRNFANQLPRPPPKPLPPPETFSSTSRPRQYYSRPLPRDLPPYHRAWPGLLAVCVGGVGVWAAFLAYAANQERLSSSAMRRVLSGLRESEEVRTILGDAVRPEPAWYLNGSPWVYGSVKMLQGNIDISFRIKGHKGAGTVYFTSIRKARGEPFTTLRFKIITDDGTIILMPCETVAAQDETHAS
ncbi:cytochrome oxidase complex assembly protein 1-domain-containing protein [Multifurca ochricompacta]|uniref:Cytochrome oxidase complex assembly protein 1-domain-containing protein n=1 Tax=Multifurca ochricompacta TaxID=376703 RepID=A0AAD4M9G0_9AGAM|nr:cytochrome oxidase complex assembly protein 1-domain-containing protein [Multifurca ochricompacta]